MANGLDGAAHGSQKPAAEYQPLPWTIPKVWPPPAPTVYMANGNSDKVANSKVPVKSAGTVVNSVAHQKQQPKHSSKAADYHAGDTPATPATDKHLHTSSFKLDL